MIDSFGRSIDYLRISVTDRCNLRCRYCMPSGPVRFLPRREILSFEEIVQVVRAGVSEGITKIRLTGGEPLVRRDIEILVAAIAAVPGLEELCMTTNGTLLAQHARDLARAGLDRVNVSLDTTDAKRYRWLTRGGNLQSVLEGIDAALDAGLTPIKLNCVVAESSSEPDALSVADFAGNKGLEVRFIPRIDLAGGCFGVVMGGSGGDCRRCNRLRLSSNGMIRPCLLSDVSFSVRRLGPGEALRRAVAAKPESGGPCKDQWMYAIGG